MSFSVRKENGVLVFEDHGGFQSRNTSVMRCIKNADELFSWPDFPEIQIHTHDYERDDSQFTFSKQNHTEKTVPDFIFDKWPEAKIFDYDQTISEIQECGSVPATHHRIGWIGNPQTNRTRLKLLEFHDGKAFDVLAFNWNKPDPFVSLQDLTRHYSVLLDIEGNGYSGRLKLLFWSQRPVILVERPHKEFFFDGLKPWVHYIPVKRDLSDLREKADWCLQNYEEAKQVAQNALRFASRHLTRKACYLQWNSIIRGILHPLEASRDA
jgi:hypothetical protein